MIILLPKPPVQECECALCNARRLESDQAINEQMEDRLRSLGKGVASWLQASPT